MGEGNLIDAPLEKEEIMPSDAVDPGKTIAQTIAGNFYKGCTGKFHKQSDIIDLIAPFKEFYMNMKREDLNATATAVVNAFNDSIAPLQFFPYPKQYSRWRNEWDKALLAERGMAAEETERKTRVRQAITLADEAALVPDDELLDSATNTLGGELLKDALETMRNGGLDEEMFDEKTIMGRKKFVLNVFKELTKRNQGAAALKLKESADKRDQASFLFDLLRRAQAGKLLPGDMGIIKGTKPDGESIEA